MKNFINFTLIVFVNCYSFGQPFTFNQGTTTAKNYYNKIPYETIKGKIFIYVEVAGKKRKFLFDTGAPTAIDKQLVSLMKLTELQKSLFADANGNKDSITIVRLKNIKIGSITFKDIPAVGLIPEFLKCWKVEGVLGSNALRNSIVKIDPTKHLISITDNEDSLLLKNKTGIPLITTNYAQTFPNLNILLKDKINVEFGFDTGDPGFLSIPEEYMNQLSKYNVFETLSIGYGANKLGELGMGKSDSTYRLKIYFLKIGNIKFDNVITETEKDGIPRIGSKILDYGAVTLDFIHSKFYFDATKPENELNEKLWPFSPIIKDHKLIVGTVWGKLKDLIISGQEILKIDNILYPQVELCNWINNKSVLDNKEKIMLTIKDEQGKIKTFQVMKE